MVTAKELYQKALQHKASIDSALKDIKDNHIMISQYQRELDNITRERDTLSMCYEYLDALIKEESGKFIARLRDILDYGVKTIFDDCEYSVDIRTNDSKTSIHLVYEDAEGNILSPDVQVCGGGIRSVIGLLLQVFMLFHYKSEPILFCDESLSQISSQYVENTMSLLNELAQKNSMKVMLVTHDPRFMDYAKKIFEVDNGKVTVIKEPVGNANA